MMPQLPNAIDQQASNWLYPPQQTVGGRPVIIYFWSISCTICKEKMPVFLDFSNHERQFFDILLVHVPRSTSDLDIQKIHDYAVNKNIDLPVYLDQRHQMKNTFRVQKLPCIVLLDRKGRLRHMQSGGNFTTMLINQLDALRYS
ncbi:TlpA family protein disulfide reductase [Terribacillus saccharophilus]|uniref:TlpA family protein disulfide reductase n=1 Tax=Terribacillus saccharophilus TaxID=361277 RepID=UPI002DC27E6C|nr:TlpA disulfide reductase family protein [Terribacillus saccharophilus]MEC0289959.1 TlpA disulfide reductase family protein [Terribacillus saccharophilus]